MNVWFTEWKTATIESASLHIKKLQPNQIPQTEIERVLQKNFLRWGWNNREYNVLNQRQSVNVGVLQCEINREERTNLGLDWMWNFIKVHIKLAVQCIRGAEILYPTFGLMPRGRFIILGVNYFWLYIIWLDYKREPDASANYKILQNFSVN